MVTYGKESEKDLLSRSKSVQQTPMSPLWWKDIQNSRRGILLRVVRKHKPRGGICASDEGVFLKVSYGQSKEGKIGSLE